MHIVTLGDVMLDVIVDAHAGLKVDDDAEASITLAAGGQAANVATWAVALGAAATVIGPRGDSDAAGLVAEQLRSSGVAYTGIPVEGGGTVVSIISGGTRTMASDAGDQSWVVRVSPSDLPGDAEWLHLSAYPLLRATGASAVTRLVFEARSQGTSISVDLASASLISGYGVEAFAGLLNGLRPDVVFANQAEWQAIGRLFESTSSAVVLKQGRQGVTIRQGNAIQAYDALAAEVLDATGAGDAFAAGYLVGGAQLGLETAARCVAQRGAQPRPPG